jgi:maltose alpha-D-glucosyltransferase/alpha-amylase
VELDLARFRGRVPIELTGRSAFPPVGDLPYMLTLAAYGFFWFLLTDEEKAPSWHETMPEILPEFITLTARDGRIETALSGREKGQLEADVLPQFLPLQRWFGAKDAEIGKVSLTPLGELSEGEHALVAVDVGLGSGEQRYFLPISARWGDDNLRPGAPKLSYTLAKIRRGPKVGALIDGAYDERLALRLLEAMREGREIEGPAGTVRCHATAAFAAIPDLGEPRPLGVEQSNVSIAFGDKVILKVYRRLRPGPQPDVEVARFLTETAGYSHTPAYFGSIEVEGEEPTTLAAAFAFVPNQGDAWGNVVEALQRDLDEAGMRSASAEPEPHPEGFAFPLGIGALLGQRTAELHKALATATDDPAFAVEPVGAADLARWTGDVSADFAAVAARLRDARDIPPELGQEVAALVAGGPELEERIARVAAMAPSGGRSRIHGDYHLGQVLIAQNDVAIIDFEGEPMRSLAERRAKHSPLRDVAGMLRSFDYAASMALDLHRAAFPDAGEAAPARALQWREETTAAFLAAYRAHAAGAATIPEGPALAGALLDLFLLQKAIYEIDYELGNRPAWLRIPLRGVLDLLAREG